MSDEAYSSDSLSSSPSLSAMAATAASFSLLNHLSGTAGGSRLSPPLKSDDATTSFKHLSRRRLGYYGLPPARCGSVRAGFMVPSGTGTALSPDLLPNVGSSTQDLGLASNSIQGLVIADIDPATAKLAIGILGPFLSAFGFLFIVRIVMSWYPKLPVGKFPYVIAYAPTEPILVQTRKVIPPLGGVDVTPVVWFGLISFLNEILVGPQGLLVLLSQKLGS